MVESGQYFDIYLNLSLLTTGVLMEHLIFLNLKVKVMLEENNWSFLEIISHSMTI